jgi:hypothetical protein
MPRIILSHWQRRNTSSTKLDTNNIPSHVDIVSAKTTRYGAAIGGCNVTGQFGVSEQYPVAARVWRGRARTAMVMIVTGYSLQVSILGDAVIDYLNSDQPLRITLAAVTAPWYPALSPSN